MSDLVQLMYTAEVYYSYDDYPPKFAVYLLFAIDDKEAMKKALVLGSSYQISSIKLRSYSEFYLKQVASASGGTYITDIEIPYE